jgi:SAM-dependent methyltransferase
VNGIVQFAPELAAGDGRDADYPFDALREAEASHFWFLNRTQLILATLGRFFPRAQSFLDIGAGIGGILEAIEQHYPEMRLVGGEVLSRALSIARRRLGRTELLQVDAYRMPFVSEFDVVGAFDVLEHMDRDDDLIAAMRDVVRPGGGVIVTVPQHPWLYSTFDELSGHRRRYTRKLLVDKMQRAGLKIVRVTSFTSTVLPALAMARARPRRVELAREVRTPRVFNGVMLAASAAERAMIARGLSLPFGGSLLAVAVRAD